MSNETVHDLAANVAEAHVRLQACCASEREKRQEFKQAEAERWRAEVDLLNAREALDKAMGVESGMFGEARVVDA